MILERSIERRLCLSSRGMRMSALSRRLRGSSCGDPMLAAIIQSSAFRWVLHYI
jgi:hypothetical protein